MKNRIKAHIVMAVIGFTLITCNTDTGTDTGPQPIENPLHSKWPFYVGAAAPTDAFAPSDGQYALLGHFNVLVAENAMKPESLMPGEWAGWQSSAPYSASGAYRWTEADKLVNYAKANNTKIRGHLLFWHSAPDVFFTTGNASAPLITKEVLYERMERHVKTVFQKYKGDILWWDVANETVGDWGDNHEPKPSGFTAVMTNAGVSGDARYDWIVEAFKFARRYADENGGQDVKLFLTEYGIESPQSWAAPKLTAFLGLVDYLIAKGAPIDGVGIQGHTGIDVANSYVNSLSSAIDQITTRKNPVNQKNLVVQVTELDIVLFVEGDGNRLTLSQSEINERLQIQATMYRNLFDMFAVKHREGKLDMVLTWGLDDGHSWKNNTPEGRIDHPLLFDRKYKPKPAFDALITGPSSGGGGGGGEPAETVVGSFNANAPYANLSNLSSSVAYQIVNLTGESRTDVMKVTNPSGYAVALYDLSAHKDTSVTITFSADVKRVGAAGTLNWQVNNSDYPSVGTLSNAAAGTWHAMSWTWTGTPTADNPSFYLSTYQNNSDSTTYYIDDFTISIE